MRTSSNYCCGNEAGLVDKFIGSAYDVVKLVADNLEDIKGLYDLLNKYGMVVAVDDANKVAALPVLSKFARVYTYSKDSQRGVYTDYLYVPDNKSGIIPNDPKATGSWVIVYSSESGGELETTYIPWVYNNGSAFGDETEIHVPDNTVGVPFIYINGSFQLVGYGYTYNPGTHVVTLSEPLNIKDEVVLMLSGLPAVPDNPNVSDFTIINWLYKNGSAVGGETVIHPPYTFQHVPAVFINGLRKVQPMDYTVNLDTFDISLKAPLKPGDTVVVQLGGELNTFQVDSSIGFEALRRSYAEAGMNLVKGSFEEGAVLTDSQDVLLQRSTGKCFNWQATLPNDGKIIPAGSTLESTGGIGANKWQEVTDVTQYSQAQYSDGISYKTYCAWQGQVTLQHKYEAVQFKQGGMFYRWDGVIPTGGLLIPQGTSTPSPEQTGKGKYVAILDLEVKDTIFGSFSKPDGASLVGVATYADIAAYGGSATRINCSGASSKFDGGEGVFVLDTQDVTTPPYTGMVILDALGRRWKRSYSGDVMAKWCGVKGDKVTDDTDRFLEACAYCKTYNKVLDISSLKIPLRTLSTSINLDGFRIKGNGVPKILPTLHYDYINGSDQAEQVWMLEADFIGSAIFSPANMAIFTGKALNINDVLLVGDYNKPSNTGFYQSTPAGYPGWSRALEEASVTMHYFGAWGIKLLGGLEVCNPKNIKVAFTKQNCLYIDGLNKDINCPIEYLYFDESNYFMYSKVNNVLVNGMRKDVEFSPLLLLNGPGQYDVVKHFDPSFKVSSIGEAMAAVSVVAAPAGVYGGLAHSGSYGLRFGGYAEACHNLLTTSSGFINDVEVMNTVMYPVDSTWPVAQFIAYNAISKLRTNGNKLPDGKFYYWLDAVTRSSLVAVDINEELLSAAVCLSPKVDPNKKVAKTLDVLVNLGSGAGGDARFNIGDFLKLRAEVASPARAVALLITSNLGTTADPSMGAYIVIVSRHASNSWTGIVMPSGNTAGFASQPVVSSDGTLSMSLAAGYYASAVPLNAVPL